jgi:HK97 family phage prohead protease
MAHLHVHTLPDGRETGPAIIDSVNANLHAHAIDDGVTSTDAFGAGHTHTFQGEQTSLPIDRDSVHLDDDDEKGSKKMKRENKQIGGNVVEVKQVERNGVQIGIVAGYIATWDLDRGAWGVKDQFIKGAFLESLNELRAKNRQIRLKDHHDRTIGGFPIDGVFEDERGLFGTGEINLEVQQGREAFSLAKQGVLSDFSIGFSIQEDVIRRMEGFELREISKAIVWEGSIVDEPMNPEAQITEVKTVVPFQDLPLADQGRAWDSDQAVARIREFTDSEDAPSATYRQAFLWFDSDDADSFGAYKLPIADVIDGTLTAVPRGIFAAAGALQGARGGVDLPTEDRPRVIRNVERYYDKMGLDSPFTEEDGKGLVTADTVKDWGEKEIEKALHNGTKLSKKAAKLAISKLKGGKESSQDYNDKDLTDLLSSIKSMSDSIGN